MSSVLGKSIRGHEPLRVPRGWDDQEKALIVQLEKLFDDIFRRFGRLRREDLGEELNALIDQILSDLEAAGEDISAIEELLGDSTMGTTATTVTGAIAEHETDLTGINNKIGDTTLPTTAQTLTGAIAEISGNITALYGLTVTQLKAK